jgi:hypothetical protein
MKLDKNGKKYMKAVGKSIKGQNPKDNFGKLSGLNSKENAGIDPITNASYPKKKGK